MMIVLGDSGRSLGICDDLAVVKFEMAASLMNGSCHLWYPSILVENFSPLPTLSIRRVP